MRLAIVLFALTLTAHAQWDMQDAHTTASLRGIDNVGDGVAWASGTGGTILRTEDGGFVWQLCAIPPGAEKLDFRGIQAFDANTAIAMSSGPGDQSRLYKTTDGCQTWKLIFTNPDKDGFWDAIGLTKTDITILGDPVDGLFTLFTVNVDDPTFIHPIPWYKSITTPPQLQMRSPEPGDVNEAYLRTDLPHELEHNPVPLEDESFFAASNSAYIDLGKFGFAFVSGGPKAARALIYDCRAFNWIHCDWDIHGLTMSHAESAGAFSISAAPMESKSSKNSANLALIVVGGNYKQPNETSGTAAFSNDTGQHWHAATTPPHGYRSAVAYDTQQKLWITVGPNGTDISTDDGRNWRALRPGPEDQPEADKNWNALSLPYVVGPKGRIGKLRPITLSAPPKKPQPQSLQRP